MDQTLAVRPGAVIAGIGTGSVILHPFRMAEKVGPGGKVICVDVRQPAIENITKQAEARHVTNVRAVLGKEDDPLLARNVRFRSAVKFLSRVHAAVAGREALKPGGRLVVAELYSDAHRGEPRDEQVKRHDLASEILERELSAAGFVITGRLDRAPVEGDRFRYLLEAEKSN
jgi:predicted methyltransferase